MNYLKSKTLILAFLTAVIPQAIDLLPNLREVLAENYGLVFFGLSILMAVVRVYTTKPLDKK